MRRLFALPVLALLLPFTALAADPAPARPNIVVFIADDHGMLDSQAYGSTEVRTPQMAKLAADAGLDVLDDRADHAVRVEMG